MPAHEHINQQQLRGMFANDFYDPFNVENIKVGELEVDHVWTDSDEISYGYLHDSIKKEGIKTPLKVSIKDNMLYEGHHRAVVALNLGIDNIPIINQD